MDRSALAVVVALFLLLPSCAKSPRPDPIVNMASTWKQKHDDLVRETQALQAEFAEWQRRETDMLGRMTTPEIEAYSSLKDTLDGDDNAKFVLAYRKVNEVLKAKPATREEVYQLLLDLESWQERAADHNVRSAELQRQKKQISDFATALYITDQQRKAERARQADISEQRAIEQRNNERLLYELRSINAAIQSR